ncbi:MAG: MFS transporter [Oscillospiraceae bacterium]|nr:MFS transporter [Oscillospiraceae bacterium]
MPEQRQPLWTRSFTTLIFGSAVTMLGHSLSGFAVSLLVLDYTGSVMLYSIYMVAYCLPMVVMPLLAGPWMDNFSRVKMIYGLDFLSAFLYLGAWALLRRGLFSYGPFLAAVLLVGSIDSIYLVAYDSLFPTLISEGNYRRGYAVSSLLYPLATIMTPVASWIYESWGVEPLFLANFFLFLLAAVFETGIKAPETYRLGKSGHHERGYMLSELRAGLRYLKGEPGLLVISVYFFFCMLCDHAAALMYLPYFKTTAGLGVMMYSYIQAFGVAGRLVGGGLQYRFRLPAEKKLAITLGIYLCYSLLHGSLLFLPPWAMILNCFVTGILGITSYNIRLSTTQSYVPDEYRGRFTGIFQMITQAGTVIGQLLGGALGERLPLRGLVVGFHGFLILVCLGFLLPCSRYVRDIFNRDL